MKNRQYARANVSVAVVLLICGLLSGCAATEMKNSWRSPTFEGPRFQKVLVIGMARRGEVRRIYEDAMARQLRSQGAEGMVSYTMLPDTDLNNQDAINRAIAESGADSVLVTHLVKSEKRDVVIPPSPRMQEYIDTAWPGTYTPEVAGHTDIVTLETRLFQAGTGMLTWSGTTQTFDAQDLQKAVSSLSKIVAAALARSGLI